MQTMSYIVAFMGKIIHSAEATAYSTKILQEPDKQLDYEVPSSHSRRQTLLHRNAPQNMALQYNARDKSHPCSATPR